MIIWTDAQLSPAIATWISEQYQIETASLRTLGLNKATDREVFFAARNVSAVVMTKDSDFLELLEQFGSPPQVIWITCGNTSNFKLKQILSNTLSQSLTLLQQGESLVEIGDI